VLRNTPMMASVRMTRREQQITDLIAEGLSNKEIAQRLNIATYTVKSHVHNILEKLALHSRLQIAAHAHKKTPPKATAASSSANTPSVGEIDLGRVRGSGRLQLEIRRGFLPSTLAVSTCERRM